MTENTAHNTAHNLDNLDAPTVHETDNEVAGEGKQLIQMQSCEREQFVTALVLYCSPRDGYFVNMATTSPFRACGSLAANDPVMRSNPLMNASTLEQLKKRPGVIQNDADMSLTAVSASGFRGYEAYQDMETRRLTRLVLYPASVSDKGLEMIAPAYHASRSHLIARFPRNSGERVTSVDIQLTPDHYVRDVRMFFKDFSKTDGAVSNPLYLLGWSLLGLTALGTAAWFSSRAVKKKNDSGAGQGRAENPSLEQFGSV